jgi:hypothetical protein
MTEWVRGNRDQMQAPFAFAHRDALLGRQTAHEVTRAYEEALGFTAIISPKGTIRIFPRNGIEK